MMSQDFTKAYVILIHKSPRQAKRLIDALNDGRSVFFIHVDRAVDINHFNEILGVPGHVKFIPREVTRWASYGIVQAIINALKAINEFGTEFSKIMLLSGQDYPIKSNQFIEEWAKRHSREIHLEHFHLPAPEKWQPNGGLYRVTKYFIGLGMVDRLISRSLNLTSRFFPVLRRRGYRGMQPFAGSMWWNLNMDALRYILAFIRENPGYVNFHQYTFACDEVFFHTILLNSDDERIRPHIRNTDMRYIKWKSREASHPEIISEGDFSELKESPALFARKFDDTRDTAILKLIDQFRNTSKAV